MIVLSLQSGSNGNCLYVESRGTRLLFDAGISGRTAQMRARLRGLDLEGAHGLFLSHDHSDHMAGAGVFHRKFGCPIFATEATWSVSSRRRKQGKVRGIRHFAPGDIVDVGGLRVETFSTPHDGVDGVAFVVDDGRNRFGVMTDLGHPFAELRRSLASVDAAFLESNFDPWMLKSGPYSESLKRRIAGPRGHISNFEAAELLEGALEGGRLRWACLAHLSEENNDPAIALKTHGRRLPEGFPLFVAGRYGPSEILEV